MLDRCEISDRLLPRREERIPMRKPVRQKLRIRKSIMEDAFYGGGAEYFANMYLKAKTPERQKLIIKALKDSIKGYDAYSASLYYADFENKIDSPINELWFEGKSPYGKSVDQLLDLFFFQVKLLQAVITDSNQFVL